MSRWPNGDRPASEMTKREALAMAAMQGLLSGELVGPRLVAAEAIQYADALLAELAQDGPA